MYILESGPDAHRAQPALLIISHSNTLIRTCGEKYSEMVKCLIECNRNNQFLDF